MSQTQSGRTGGGTHQPPHEPPPPPHEPPPSAYSTSRPASYDPARRRGDYSQARCKALCDKAEALAARLGTVLGADDLAALNDVVTQLKAMAGEPDEAPAAA